ncbi:MAG: cyclic nucleotide-binding domain-containing protein [Pedosphaera sp.]|nr:cyclic nucleotide-binding domain-containing protein [Pedosphaera sp.]
MNDTTDEATYRIWACNNQVYGPITLPILIEWVQDARVLRNTWVYSDGAKSWRLAETITALDDQFQPGEATLFLRRQEAECAGVELEELRQFSLFSCLSRHELTQLVRRCELKQYAHGEVVIRQDEPGDALFLVLSGSVRARLMVGGNDKTLVLIPPGEFVGEMAMFTQRPRAADGVAEGQTRLLRFSAEAFRQLIEESPAVAAPLLYSIAGTMADRIMADNQRFKKEVMAEFLWR